jgi:two-component system, cell cycle response regulator
MNRNEENKPIGILLIEDNRDDAELLEATLAEAKSFKSVCDVQGTLSQGIERLSRGGIQIVLLDLGLPDSLGFGTFEQIYAHHPEIPIIILSGLSDEDLAIKTVQEGAQDYLVKGDFDSNLLARSIRYAIERHKIQAELKSLSLVDELTGLYNRRGFLTLARQQVKIASRLRKKVLLMYADMDNLKWINDTLGHTEGDRALKDIGEILTHTFRASDLVARVGGDEFVIFGMEEAEAAFDKMRTRLQQNIDSYLEKTGRRYPLSLSMGILRYAPDQPQDLDELLAEADQLMYKEKLLKKSRPIPAD